MSESGGTADLLILLPATIYKHKTVHQTACTEHGDCCTHVTTESAPYSPPARLILHHFSSAPHRSTQQATRTVNALVEEQLLSLRCSSVVFGICLNTFDRGQFIALFAFGLRSLSISGDRNFAPKPGDAAGGASQAPSRAPDAVPAILLGTSLQVMWPRAISQASDAPECR